MNIHLKKSFIHCSGFLTNLFDGPSQLWAASSLCFRQNVLQQVLQLTLTTCKRICTTSPLPDMTVLTRVNLFLLASFIRASVNIKLQSHHSIIIIIPKSTITFLAVSLMQSLWMCWSTCKHIICNMLLICSLYSHLYIGVFTPLNRYSLIAQGTHWNTHILSNSRIHHKDNANKTTLA